MKEFYVYIIRSKKDGSFYIGLTENLNRRIFEHNNNLSRYTNLKGPWSLVWYCVFQNKRKAELFEKYLKSGSGRAFAAKRLISNPP